MTSSAPTLPHADYLHDGKGIWSWLTTTDHKRIGLLYLFSILIFFVFAMGLGVFLLFLVFKRKRAPVVSEATRDPDASAAKEGTV